MLSMRGRRARVINAGSPLAVAAKRKQDKVPDWKAPSCPYTVDEKVLCFEPDPLKCKVLYDAKVLKIVSRPGQSGKTEFQYLIHFQGWNSSWDRYVADDLIMKDTPVIRKLQKELNEAAAAQLKQRKQKRMKEQGSCSTSTTTDMPPPKKSKPMILGKRGGNRRGEEDPPFIQVQEKETENPEGRPGPGEPRDEEYKIKITVVGPYVELLELDYFKIHAEKKLPTLPAPISIVQMLEKFVKSNALRQLESWFEKYRRDIMMGRRNEPTGTTRGQILPPGLKPFPPTCFASRQFPDMKTPDDLVKITHEVYIMSELATDLTLIFEAYVELMLLYKLEKGKYAECVESSPVLEKSWPMEIPEGLRFFEADELLLPEEAEKERLEEEAQQPSTSKASTGRKRKGRQSVAVALPLGDTEPLRVELYHSRRRIARFVRDLLAWKITDGYCPEHALIYGMPHLLRFLIKIPSILTTTDLPKARLMQVGTFVNRLLSFILEEYNEEHMIYYKVEQGSTTQGPDSDSSVPIQGQQKTTPEPTPTTHSEEMAQTS